MRTLVWVSIAGMVWGATALADFTENWNPSPKHFAAAERRQQCRSLRAVLRQQSEKGAQHEAYEARIERALGDARDQLLTCAKSRGLKASRPGFEDAVAEYCAAAYDRWIQVGTQLQMQRAETKVHAESVQQLELRVSGQCPKLVQGLAQTSVEYAPTEPASN